MRLAGGASLAALALAAGVASAATPPPNSPGCEVSGALSRTAAKFLVQYGTLPGWPNPLPAFDRHAIGLQVMPDGGATLIDAGSTSAVKPTRHFHLSRREVASLESLIAAAGFSSLAPCYSAGAAVEDAGSTTVIAHGKTVVINGSTNGPARLRPLVRSLDRYSAAHGSG
jgi:hypothetical protein